LNIAVLYGDAVIDIIIYLPSNILSYSESVIISDAHISPGGAASNTATALRRLGVDVRIATAVGDDALGKVLLDDFDREGIGRELIKVLNGVGTGFVVSLVLRGGKKILLSYRGASRWNILDVERLGKLVRGASIVYISGYVFDNIDSGDSAIALAREANAMGAKVFLELGGFPAEKRHRLAELRGLIDFASLNAEELKLLTGASTVEDGLRALHSLLKPRYIVLKLGEEGSALFDGEKIVSVESCRIRAVDPTGCGDAFNAGFIYAILKGFSIVEATRIGNAMGAYKAMGRGARHLPRNVDELREFIKSSCPYKLGV